MTTLTWRPGSLLPYTSMWLTLRKLAYLNSLRVSDFPLGMEAKHGPSYARALNDVDIFTLSRLIQEPPEVFSYCDRRFIPNCWRFLFSNANSFCETCMSLGYHTRLFSLKLLDRCPIHGEPLQADCPCMGGLGEKVNFTSLNSPYTCHCGSMMYFDPDRLHKNDHLLIDTNKLVPIVKWLRSLNKIHVGSYMKASFDSIYVSNWLVRLFEISKMHNFPYPSAFIKFKLPHYQWPYKIKSIVFSDDPVPSSNVPPSIFSFGHGVPKEVSVDVYKSFTRYLRKYVTRRTEFWINEFKSIAIPEEIAQLLRTNQEAKLAFTEMIWARCVEPSVTHRRWDNRIKYHTSGVQYACTFSGILADAAANLNLFIEKESKNIVKDWVRWHTFGYFCIAIWRQAEKMVEYGIRRNLAFWDPTWIDQSNLFSLTVTKFSNENSVELTFYADEPLSLPKRRGLSKEQRVSRFQTACKDKHTQYLNCCKGLCLSWSKSEGWHTAQSVELSMVWTLHQVMIGPQQIIKALLYQVDGYFILRLVDYKLQVFSLNTSDLFNLMRQCFKEYCKLNNIPLTNKIEPKVEQEKSTTEAIGFDEEYFLQYKCRCQLETNHNGFCKSAVMIEFCTYVHFANLR